MRNRKGFTLIEIVIYLIIFGVLGIFAARLLDVALDARVTVGRLNTVQTESQRALSQLADRIRAASSVLGYSGIALNLSMSNPSLDPTYIFYSAATKNITISEGGAAGLPLFSSSTLISSFSLTGIENPSPFGTSTSFLIQITTGHVQDRSLNSIDENTLYSLQTVATPL